MAHEGHKPRHQRNWCPDDAERVQVGRLHSQMHVLLGRCHATRSSRESCLFCRLQRGRLGDRSVGGIDPAVATKGRQLCLSQCSATDSVQNVRDLLVKRLAGGIAPLQLRMVCKLRTGCCLVQHDIGSSSAHCQTQASCCKFSEPCHIRARVRSGRVVRCWTRKHHHARVHGQRNPTALAYMRHTSRPVLHLNV